MYLGNSISLIVPCRNEAGGIRRLIKSVPDFVDEVLVIDNGSTDRTYECAYRAGAVVIREPRTDVLGIGYGFAHMTGIAHARGDILVTMDGDGTYPVDQIEEVLKYFFKSKLDMLSCSRFPLHKDEALSSVRRLGVWVLNTMIRGLYHYPMHDVLSGMWIIKKDVVQNLELVEGGWDFSPEIKLAALTSNNVKFGEHRIKHYERRNDKSKQQLWITGTRHLLYITKRWLFKDGGFTNWFSFWRRWSEKSVVRTIAQCKC